MKYELESIGLLPGNSIIELEDEFANIEASGIILPDMLRNRPVRIGRVLKTSMTGRCRAHLGIDDLIGTRVVVDGKFGQWIEERRYRVPNLVELAKPDGTRYKPARYTSPIVAIIPDDVKASSVSDEARRCQWCGPAKSENSQQNVVLVPGENGKLYCPRCKKQEDGTPYRHEWKECVRS